MLPTSIQDRTPWDWTTRNSGFTYHSSAYPWDTSDFYAEVWDPVGYPDTGMYPYELLDRQVVSAEHLTAVFNYYDPPLTAGETSVDIMASDTSGR
ncbi:MAG: hypothetical protein K8S15_07345 [Candidatus Aegiribacteria sp.]|nr:hypothetical protein [Candidatus Aegiribacteria sp.]